jgi:hypothetical protein
VHRIDAHVFTFEWVFADVGDTISGHPN